jgi:drug/metabolite transporter (DMT)-like permease
MTANQETRGGVVYRRPGVNDALDPFAITTLIALSAIWGLGQVAVKVVNTGLQPVFQAGLRSLLGCLLAMLWCRYRGVKLFERDGTLVAGIIVGLLFGAEFIFIYLGFDYTTISRGIIFIFFAPLVVALGAHFLIPTERLTTVRSIGFVAAFLGVVVIFSDKLSLPSPQAIIGDVMCLIAAVLWGATTLVIKTTRLNLIAPEKVLIYQLGFSAPLMLAAAPFFGPFIRDLDTIVILAFAYQVVIIVTASYLVWFWLIAYYPAAQLYAFAFLSPLFTVMFGGLLLGETLSPRLLIALALVAAGIYLASRQPKKR